jgi:hypothetical protein
MSKSASAARRPANGIAGRQSPAPIARDRNAGWRTCSGPGSRDM